MTVKDSLTAMNEMTSKGADRLSSLGDLNLKVWEKLAARQLEALNLMMEQSVRQMKIASEAKGYNEFVKAQVEMAKEASERMMEEVRTNMALANEVRDEYRAWAQAGMSEMTAEIKKSVASAA
ncbi:MAG: phasin family protein [Chromatiaceae bacterium]|jgi:phasin family protein|nr:phasin family protein [Candidatus Thioaporhodococcus sediminis]